VNELLRLPFLRVRAQTLLNAFHPKKTTSDSSAPHDPPSSSPSLSTINPEHKVSSPNQTITQKHTHVKAAAHPIQTTNVESPSDCLDKHPTQASQPQRTEMEDATVPATEHTVSDEGFSDSQGLFHFYFMGQTLELSSIPVHQVSLHPFQFCMAHFAGYCRMTTNFCSFAVLNVDEV
jgi:hypothetical protein